MWRIGRVRGGTGTQEQENRGRYGEVRSGSGRRKRSCGRTGSGRHDGEGGREIDAAQGICAEEVVSDELCEVLVGHGRAFVWLEDDVAAEDEDVGCVGVRGRVRWSARKRRGYAQMAMNEHGLRGVSGRRRWREGARTR